MHVHAGDMANAKTSRVLRISLAVTLLYIVLLVIAGIRAHSLALLSEAGHNLTDFVALLMSWLAVYLQARPPNLHKTFGYHRAGVLAAFVLIDRLRTTAELAPWVVALEAMGDPGAALPAPAASAPSRARISSASYRFCSVISSASPTIRISFPA